MSDSCHDNTTTPAHASRTLKQRKGEQIGGGWFVFGRSARDGRIHPTGAPFEHPTLASAEAEAWRLARTKPDRTFLVCGVVASARVSTPAKDRQSEEPEYRATHSRNAVPPGAVTSSSLCSAGADRDGGAND